MEHEELIKRAADLAARCEKTACLTQSGFLTPAEQLALTDWARREGETGLLLHGGHPDCERKAAFFLPFYMGVADFDPAEQIRAVELSCAFGQPEHRDYMGAVLGLGIKREWVGDIWVQENRATVFCLPSVESHILLNLDKVGRCGVKARAIALADVPAPRREWKETVFSVQSPRLDAVTAGMFHLSRTAAAEAIAAGLVSLNYAECLKPDAPVGAGDVLSLRGKGKGKVMELGGQSRKGRLFVKTGICK
ncbi:MAG: RNA-binding protein [Oscillospiraceae bacterium]